MFSKFLFGVNEKVSILVGYQISSEMEDMCIVIFKVYIEK